jgi:hypothetical protein
MYLFPVDRNASWCLPRHGEGSWESGLRASEREREREGGEGSSWRWRELGFMVVCFALLQQLGVKKGRLEKAETLCSLTPSSLNYRRLLAA